MNTSPRMIPALLFCTLIFASCNNARLRPAKAKTSAVVVTSSAPTILSAVMNLQQNSVTVQMDSTKEALTNYCTLASAGSGTPSERSCACAYEWSTVNGMGGSASTVLIPRSATLPLTGVNLYSATCALPSLANVQEGTGIKIKVIGQGAQNSTMQTNTMTSIYNTTTQTSSCGSASSSENCVIDQTGISYFNAIRYACFEYFQRDTAFRNQRVTITADDSSVELPVANKFCFAGKASESGSSSLESCSVSQLEYTAQSNYYNLLTRSNNANFTQNNVNYFCPRVRAEDRIQTTTSQQFPGFPATPAFLVAPTWSTENPIGLEAPTVLGDSGSQTNNRTFCKKTDGTAGPASVTSGSNEIANGCVGYVSAVNSSGSCNPKMVDGVLRNQYRVRRYIAKFPTLFQSSGHVDKDAPIFVDQFYSIDRPVGTNPTDGFSMLGPKPCPQAYFDRKAVTGLLAREGNSPVETRAYTWNADREYRPGYVATNSTQWTDRNVDGVRFPNRDANFLQSEPISCAAALPIYSSPATLTSDEVVSVFTSHATNKADVNLGRGRIRKLDEIHVRPLDPFVPEYVEDPNFKACAMEPQGGFKSPMHFANVQVEGQTQTAYCEEIYPTQNDNVAALDRPIYPVPNPLPPFTPSPYPGAVKVYTSHVVTPSPLAQIHSCDATQLSNLPTTGAYTTPAPSTGAGTFLANRHHANTIIDPVFNIGANKTCDRTVDNNQGTGQPLGFSYFPLLAEPLDVHIALQSHSQYRCTITKDNGDGRTGIDTPTGGCSRLVPKTTPSAHTEPEHVHLPPTY